NCCGRSSLLDLVMIFPRSQLSAARHRHAPRFSSVGARAHQAAERPRGCLIWDKAASWLLIPEINCDVRLIWRRRDHKIRLNERNRALGICGGHSHFALNAETGWLAHVNGYEIRKLKTAPEKRAAVARFGLEGGHLGYRTRHLNRPVVWDFVNGNEPRA